MKILLTADLHLGRRSSHLPAGMDGAAFSSAATWEATVSLAIAQHVDLVLLGGDVVDEDNKFWEALGPLERGLTRLGEAGIRTIAVAGNHDFDTLPRLARHLDPATFRLLGEGGQWEACVVGNGREDDEAQRTSRESIGRIRVVGWSFPSRHVDRSPLADPLPEPDDRDGDLPTLALVHGDLDQPRSRYGPLDLERLQAQPVAGWILGHIHAPRLLTGPGQPFVLYPGSPQALHPNETGPHGPWLLTIGGGDDELGAGGGTGGETGDRAGGARFDTPQADGPRQVPLSTIRYETVTVELTGVDTTGDFEARVIQTVRTEAERAVGASGDAAAPEDRGSTVNDSDDRLRCLRDRLVLTGQTPLHDQLDNLARALTDDLALPVGRAEVSIDRVHTRTRPELDLPALAAGRDAPALLARLLQSLDTPASPGAAPTHATEAPRGDEDRPEENDLAALIHRARDAMARVHDRRDFVEIGADPSPDDSAARRALARAAGDLLAALVTQDTGS